MRKDDQGRQRLKIVFFGPSMAGKTTALKWLYNNLEDVEKGRFTELSGSDDLTLFFDFVPFTATPHVIFDVYTTAGGDRHKTQRKIVLNSVDGILFMADSSVSALDKNKQSIAELEELEGLGKEIPLIVALNRRDLPDALPKRQLLAELGIENQPVYETIATKGFGIKKAFQSLAREVLLNRLYKDKSPIQRSIEALQ
ncbi:MAG: ATP/GTP-binding protein [Promethearchaeota archaeon]